MRNLECFMSWLEELLHVLRWRERSGAGIALDGQADGRRRDAGNDGRERGRCLFCALQFGSRWHNVKLFPREPFEGVEIHETVRTIITFLAVDRRVAIAFPGLDSGGGNEPLQRGLRLLSAHSL